MRQNSIDYPGERPARRADIVEQPGYTGKHYFVVNYAGRQLTVHAADETAALFLGGQALGLQLQAAGIPPDSQRGQAWISAGQDVRIKNALARFQPDEGREAYTSP